MNYRPGKGNERIDMGREVRKVPENWQHPKDFKGNHIPLFKGPFTEDNHNWKEENIKWQEGFRRTWDGDNWIPIEAEYLGTTYIDWAGTAPSEEDYMPEWLEEEATHLMLYETCSEGTPISPVFSTPEGLARWLADNEASAFGDQTADYDSWLRVARGGSACSAILDNNGIRPGVQ